MPTLMTETVDAFLANIEANKCAEYPVDAQTYSWSDGSSVEDDPAGVCMLLLAQGMPALAAHTARRWLRQFVAPGYYITPHSTGRGVYQLWQDGDWVYAEWSENAVDELVALSWARSDRAAVAAAKAVRASWRAEREREDG